MNFDVLAQHQLHWLPELGIGYYEVEPGNPYDESYFQKYVSYEGSDICTRLNEARVGLVKKHWGGAVLDIGIGCGSFVKAHGNAYGYDINPAGIRWLKDQGLYLEPKRIVAATFWDSFEHIRDPAEILDEITGYVFMAIPLFNNMHHVLESKHFRRDEHYWYFTFVGICKFMHMHGFEFVDFSRAEVAAGREDIGSFVFKRIN